MPRIVHFDIYADDVDRAHKFYADLFGWEITKWDGPPQMDYRLVITGTDGPGIDGAITRRPPHGMSGLNYVEVESIDDYLPRVQDGGGSVLQPKIPIPGVGYRRHLPGYRRQSHRIFPDGRNRLVLNRHRCTG